MKKFIILLLTVIMLFTLTSCKQPIADEHGNMLYYKYSEIKENGFYVHNIADDTFTPLNNGASGYQGQATEVDTSRYIWLGNNELDLIKLTPVVDNKNTELVAIFKGEGSVPSLVVLEEYKNLGYTLGVQFTVSPDNKTLYIDNTNVCDSSMMKSVLEKHTSTQLPIYSINENQELPITNVDREINMLLGLEKNKPYEISFFDGTTYDSEVVKADTMVLKSKDLVTIKSPFKKTRQGYFVVNLPENINSGYYYVNSSGMFAFKE